MTPRYVLVETTGRTTRADLDTIILRLWTIAVPLGTRRDLAELALRTGDLDEANKWLAGVATITQETP